MMSVLIKGMEMPKTCIMCWLSPICPVWVKEVSRYKGYDNRLPDCPLVEVSPHGRLIDADEAKEALRRAEALTRAFGYHNVIDTISEQPTIIEAEEGAEI